MMVATTRPMAATTMNGAIQKCQTSLARMSMALMVPADPYGSESAWPARHHGTVGEMTR